MSSSSGQNHPFEHKTPRQAYAYYKMQENLDLASDWKDTMQFCGIIGDKGKKMLLAGLITKKYCAHQIANAFTTHHFKDKTMPLGTPFKCNHNDIIKAEVYLRSMVFSPLTLKFGEMNASEFEGNEELLLELQGPIKMLEEGIPEDEINHKKIDDAR